MNQRDDDSNTASEFDVYIPIQEQTSHLASPNETSLNYDYDAEAIDEKITFETVLTHIKCVNNVPATWIEQIMDVCRATNCFPGADKLPKKWNTIAKSSPDAEKLKSPIDILSIKKNGEYCHFGLRYMLAIAEENLWLEAFGDDPQKHPPKDMPEYEIDVNIDGADVRKQGSQQNSCWPILIRVHSIKPNSWMKKTVLQRMMAPLTIGVYIGQGKPPNSTDYLGKFANELFHLNPICVDEDEQFSVSVRAIIADTPARAFIKNISSAQGYFPCEKCTESGTKPSSHCHLSIWKIKNLELRVNEKFYNYNKHVKQVKINSK